MEVDGWVWVDGQEQEWVEGESSPEAPALGCGSRLAC